MAGRLRSPRDASEDPSWQNLGLANWPLTGNRDGRFGHTRDGRLSEFVAGKLPLEFRFQLRMLGPRPTRKARRSPDRKFHAGFGHRLVTNPPPSDSLVTVTRIARRSRPHAGPKVKITRRSQFSDDLWAGGLKVVRDDRRSSAKNQADLQGGRPKVSRCGRSHSARRSKSAMGKIGSAELVTEWPQIGHILVTATCRMPKQ